MAEGRVERRLAAILAADVAGYSRLMGADEEGTLARAEGDRARADRPEDRRASRAHRQDHRRRPPGRIRQRRRCGALRGRGAARRWPSATPSPGREAHRVPHRHQSRRHHHRRRTTSSATASTSPRGSKPWPSRAGSASSRAVRDQVRDRLDIAFEDLGEQRSRTSPGRCASIAVTARAGRSPACGRERRSPGEACRRCALPDKPSIAVLPFQNMSGDPEQEYFADGMVEEIITALVAHPLALRHRPQFELHLQGPSRRCEAGRPRTRRALCARRLGAQGRQPGAHHCAADRAADRRASLGRPLRRLARRCVRAQDKVASSVAGVIEPALQAAETARSAAPPDRPI